MYYRMSVDSQLEGGQSGISEAQQGLNSFWPKVTEEIRQLTQVGVLLCNGYIHNTVGSFIHISVKKCNYFKSLDFFFWVPP